MHFTDFFIRRAISTTLLMAGILIFGIISYISLPVSNLPSVEYPTINVNANLPGANPDIMASTVATPLESQFSTIAGINSMSSSSSLGNTSITLQFDLSRSIDSAAQDVQAAISRASGALPQNMPAPPSFSKMNPSEEPILFISARSDTLDLPTVDHYAESRLARQISMVSGVSEVQVFGSEKYAVRIQASPEALAARQLDLETLRTAISTGSLNMPAGSLYGLSKAYTVQANSQLTSADQYARMIVAYRNGRPVHLDEVAHVFNSVADTHSNFALNGHPSVVLAVHKQPGSNTVEVADAVKALLPKLEAQMPAGIRFDRAFDNSVAIRESIADVKFTLLITIALVVLVIFAFLRNVSATIIPSLAVPLSLLGTFAAMKLLGFTVDILSMMAMTLSVGFVVDDAIVMLENIVRHMEMGKPRMQAAIDGAREVGFTIISMTISLAAVFIPVLFLGGVIGRLLREFSITIAVAVLISGVISLSLTPMLCSRFLRHESHPNGAFYRVTERFYVGLNDLYRRSLEWVLRHKPITLGVSIATTVLTGYLFVVMPKGFMPTVDQGFAFGGTEAAEDTSYDEMVRIQARVTDIVKSNPWVEFYGSGIEGQNQGFLFMQFKSDRHRPKAQVLARQIMGQIFTQVPGVMAFLQVPPLIRMGQGESRAQYSVALQDANTAELFAWAPKLEMKLRTVPEVTDVDSDLRLASPRLNVNIDRERALAVGVTPEAIANTLYDAYGNRRVGVIDAASDQYDVLLEVPEKLQRRPEELGRLYIKSTGNKMVPLSEVTEIEQSVAPLSVNHIGQLPAVTFQFNTKPGVSLSQASSAVEQAAHSIGMPDTVSFSYQGTAAAFQSSLQGLGLLLIIAVFVIYLVLGILYESFIHPITILSGLPSAAIGALLTLLIFHDDLNLYSFVGIILLIGIVKKNAIMMIDFALAAERNEGKSPEEAIYEGCLQRFRPIMMTTMAALLGTLPVAIGSGAGGEARRPLGLAVVGGLVLSQLLTLYITPVIYVYLDRFNRKKRKGEVLATVPVEAYANR